MAITFGLVEYGGSNAGEDMHARYRQRLGSLPPQFSTVWLWDHFQFGSGPALEGWTLLTYLAAEFPHLKFGHFVLSQGYRNPALVAKMAATLQYLTGGRYILGMGAGWHEEEYWAYGYDFPAPGVRFAQLTEALEVVRAMWATAPATYHGQYYHVEEAYCEPRPDPPVPILVGTGGRKGLQVVARLADVWSWGGPFEEWFLPTYEQLRQNCAAIGRDVREITVWPEFTVCFPADPGDFKPSTPGEAFLGPTPADAIRQLQPFVDWGATHFPLNIDAPTLERFCAEVVPAFA